MGFQSRKCGDVLIDLSAKNIGHVSQCVRFSVSGQFCTAIVVHIAGTMVLHVTAGLSLVPLTDDRILPINMCVSHFFQNSDEDLCLCMLAYNVVLSVLPR